MGAFNKRICCAEHPDGENGAYEWQIYDTDRRRYLMVHDLDHGADYTPETVDPEEIRAFYKQVLDPLEGQMDDLPPEITAVHISRDGSIVSKLTDPMEDCTTGTYFATVEEYAPPSRIGVLLRSDLTEVDRLSWFVDKVSYRQPSGEEETAVFKYYNYYDMIGRFWTELQINLHLPPHPNILRANNLVLEEVNKTGVVGFTMPFIPNGDLRYNRSTRTFKFKWLEQLTQVVDDLNLKHGILHQDIAPRNLLADPTTDNLLLYDFNFSARIGSSYSNMPGSLDVRHKPDDRRSDVKGVVFCVHDLITKAVGVDESLGWGFPITKDEASLEPRELWVQHPDVLLDRGVDAYYDFLMSWVRRRRAGPQLTDDMDVPQPLPFPHLMPLPEPEMVDWEEVFFGELDRYKERISGRWFRRTVARHYGRPFVEWLRPSTSSWDRSRRLLATGRYADEEEGEGEEGEEEKEEKEEKRKATREGQKEEGGGGSPVIGSSQSDTSRLKSRKKSNRQAVRFSARLAAKKKGGMSTQA